LALKNSFLFFAVNMLIQNPIALLLAAALSTKARGGLLYRVLIFSPAILSLAIAAFVWRLLLSPLMTFFYRTFFGSGFQKADPHMGAAVAGTMFVILLAGVLLYLFIRRRIKSYEL